ncbi:hypothetical protein ACWEOH_06110 [Agromyces sp. NPDC004153]
MTHTDKVERVEDNYDGLEFDRTELRSVMRSTYDELIDFVTTREFRTVVQEMYSLNATERPAFVLNILLDPKELAARGIHPPNGVLIQRSAFGDRRPTLFVVKKYLPDKYKSTVWQNVNITFDSEYPTEGISRDAKTAWRAPLNPAVQAAAMKDGVPLEKV